MAASSPSAAAGAGVGSGLEEEELAIIAIATIPTIHTIPAIVVAVAAFLAGKAVAIFSQKLDIVPIVMPYGPLVTRTDSGGFGGLQLTQI